MNDIVFENVYKSFGKIHVVKDMNLTITGGERLVLLGPSGCGKSTTLRIIAGLEEITTGSLYFEGNRVNEIPGGDRNVAMVFQNYALYPHMTVEENIVYALKAHKLPKAEISVRLRDAIHMLDLSGFEKRKPKELSGGQRQRVALARALVKRSQYFLLDEPLSNLDAQLRLHARKELVKIHENYNQTFVYVTHDQVEAMTVGNRIALMYQGDLQMIDTPSNVYNRPANIFTAKFIGSPPCNILSAMLCENALAIGDQRLYLKEDWLRLIYKTKATEFFLGIRPEHIQLLKEKTDTALVGSVKYIEDYGNKICIYMDLCGKELVVICEENTVRPGETVYIAPNVNKIHLFDKITTKSIGYPEI